MKCRQHRVRRVPIVLHIKLVTGREDHGRHDIIEALMDRIDQAMGLSPEKSAEENWAELRPLWEDGPRSAHERHAVNQALVSQSTEFHHINTELGCDYIDVRGAWTRCREISPDGAVLVRPDRYIAFRSVTGVDEPTATLRQALSTVLSITQG